MSALANKTADESDDELEVPPLAESEETGPKEPEVDTTLANSDVTTKYLEAAKIANLALKEVAALCVADAKLVDICRAGDDFINAQTALIYRGKGKDGKPIERGVAFPVCVSVNEVVCHCSPLESDDKFENLKVGDWVKIDLGVHIDGFMAVAAHTVIVGYKPRTAEEGGPITDDTADVFAAAWTAAEVAARMIKAGNTNAQVTAKVKEVADAYGVRGIIGTLMHQMKRYVIDGSKMILLREEPDQAKVDPCTFETYEVYAIDVAMTTGEGKPRDLGQNRTTIYKRVVDQKYSLKVKASRMLFNDILKKHPALPFTLRGFQDEKAVKLGIRECENHNLLQPYQVLHQYPGDKIAHVKFTVLLTKDQTVKVTGLAPPEGMLSSKTISPELQELLKISVEKKKKDRSRPRASEASEQAL